ncbi:hypothetical protein K525DRAFT_262455, partial [Schizophyllum commune Loenen D]
MSLGNHPRALSGPPNAPHRSSVPLYSPRFPFGALRIAISTRDAHERTRQGRLLRPLPCGRRLPSALSSL